MTEIVFAALLCVVLMAVFLFSPVPLDFQGFFPMDEEFQKGPIPYDNARIYRNDTLLENETLYLDENLIISGSTTTIRNTELIFDNARRGAIGLYVLDDATLIVSDSSITSRSYFRCEVYGNLSMTDSHISRLWGDRDHVDYDGGMEIYSKTRSSRHSIDVVLVNTTFSHCLTNGIMAGKSDPLIMNCTFHDIDDDAIELHESDAWIENVTIHHCGYGIIMDDSDPRIINTTIYDIEETPIDEGGNSDPIKRGNNITKPDESRSGGLDEYVDAVPLHLMTIAMVVMVTRPWKTIAILKRI